MRVESGGGVPLVIILNCLEGRAAIRIDSASEVTNLSMPCELESS